MAIKDIFKKRPSSASSSPKATDGRSKATEDKKEKKPAVKKAYVFSHEILRSPHITEKATDATNYNKYIFNVGLKANKIEIKKSVESNYGVDVMSVHIINIHRKKRRVGRNIGWVKGYKKAIVTVKEGQKIEIMPR